VNLKQLNRHIPTDLLFKVSRFDALEHNTLVSYRYREGTPVVVPDAESEEGRGHCVLSARFIEETSRTSPSKKRGAESASEGDDIPDQPMRKRQDTLPKHARPPGIIPLTTNWAVTQSTVLEPVQGLDIPSDKKGRKCHALAQRSLPSNTHDLLQTNQIHCPLRLWLDASGLPRTGLAHMTARS